MKAKLIFTILSAFLIILSIYFIVFEGDYLRAIYFLLIANFIKY